MSNDQQLRDTRLAFYQEDLSRIDTVLDELLRLSGARSVFLVDREGHMITDSGDSQTFDQDTISALVAGSFSATREMARILGEAQFSALYHQGERDNIQLSLVGERTILTVIFDDATTLGMVRLYVNEGVRKLTEVFEDIANRSDDEPRESLQEQFQDSARDTLDEFFKT